MITRPILARLRLALAGAMVLFVAVFAVPGTASAHTDFDSSMPADGSTVEGPLTTVTVNFTNPAVESGDGFELLGPDGVVREPISLDPTDGTTFVATFDPPLDAGEYGFRWDVQAGDAHPIQGSFQFTVVVPTTSEEVVPDPTSEDAATPATTPTTSAAVGEGSGSVEPASLEEFLEGGDDPGSVVGRVGRTMSTAGTIFAAGVIAALVAFVRGRRDELRTLIGWVRLAGFLVVAGGVTEFAALDETQSAGVVDVLGTRPGTAALLTLVAGVLIFVGFGDRAGKVVGGARSLSAAAFDVEALPEASAGDEVDANWTPDATATIGLAGLALALVSYWFDGHTVSRGPWLVHALVNLVHVGAAAVWVGGVFAMTALVLLRRRRTEPTGLAAMVVRFSGIAAVSLGALAVAGAVMTWLVIDGPSDLWSTGWGQVLIAKVAVVAVAAGMGGYNHFSLRPALEQRPADPAVVRHLRISLSIESAALLGVILLTAVLVGSAT